MKKFGILFALIAVVAMGTCACALAPGEAWIYSRHDTEVFLGASGADFNTAAFSANAIESQFNRSSLTADQLTYLQNNMLSLLLKNSEYVARSWNGFEEKVSPARDSTLPLKFREVDATTLRQTVFVGGKSPNAHYASFTGISEQGMKGREVSFSFDGEFLKTLNYKTTAEQLASVVPSIEFENSGNNITGVIVKFVSKDVPGTALFNTNLVPKINGVYAVDVTWESSQNFNWSVEQYTRFVYNGTINNNYIFSDDQQLEAKFVPAHGALPIPADTLKRVRLTFEPRENNATLRTWYFFPKLKEELYAIANISYFIETGENFQPLAKPKKAPDEEGRRVLFLAARGYKKLDKVDATFNPAVKPVTSSIRSEKGFTIGEPISSRALSDIYLESVNRFNTSYGYDGLDIASSADFTVTMGGKETSVPMDKFLKYENNTFKPRINVIFDSDTLSEIEWYYTDATGTSRISLPKNASNPRLELYAMVHGQKQRYRIDRVDFNADDKSYKYDFKRSEYDNRVRWRDPNYVDWQVLTTADLPVIKKSDLIYVMSGAIFDPEVANLEYRARYSYYFFPGYGSGITPVSADVVKGVADVGFNDMKLENYAALPDKKVVSEDEIQVGRKMEDKSKDDDVKSNLKNNVKAELVKAVTFSVPYTGDPANAGKYVLPTTLTFEAVSTDFKPAVWDKITKAADLETVLKNVHVYKILHDNTSSNVLVLDLVEIAGKDAEKIFTYQRDGDRIFISVNVLINDAAPKGHDGVVKPNEGSAGKAYILIRDGIEDKRFTDPMALGVPETALAPDPEKKPSNASSGSGCNAGFGVVVSTPLWWLLMAAPLVFVRRRK